MKSSTEHANANGLIKEIHELMGLSNIQKKPSSHPAAEWAMGTKFDAMQVDCTIAVVLKILDNKCKMLPGEKAAVMAVYDVVKRRPARLFSENTHVVITAARQQSDAEVMEIIHEMRLFSEANIPKLIMKSYKAKLRDGLFG